MFVRLRPSVIDIASLLHKVSLALLAEIVWYKHCHCLSECFRNRHCLC